MSLRALRAYLGSRSLRFRLTFSYVVLFTITLVGVGFVVRSVLSNLLYRQAESALTQQWNVARAYLRAEEGLPVWAYDKEDPEETSIVAGLRSGVYLLAQASTGEILQVSENYSELIDFTPQAVLERVRRKGPGFETREDQYSAHYILRYGTITDGPTSFFVVIGQSLEEDEAIIAQFTRYYFLFVPVGIAVICLLGWFSAGGALRPLADVASAAQGLTGQKLNVRLPERGAGDELDHLIGTFNSMVARLEQSFTQVRQFSADVSHELRTPLTIIRGHLEVALMTAERPEHYQEAIQTALQDVERLGNVVRALLQLSQAESGQLTLHHGPVDVAAIATEMSEHLSLAAEDKGQELLTDFPEPALARADRVQVERLISNLLSNAIKYTPIGGQIRLSVHSGGGQVRLTVADNGQGIPPEHLPHIFDRFYRVPGSAASPEKGLGLGLSFVAWIVKAHEGTIEVESEPGQGSRFVVSLPAAEAPAPVSDTVGVTEGAVT